MDQGVGESTSVADSFKGVHSFSRRRKAWLLKHVIPYADTLMPQLVDPTVHSTTLRQLMCSIFKFLRCQFIRYMLIHLYDQLGGCRSSC